MLETCNNIEKCNQERSLVVVEAFDIYEKTIVICTKCKREITKKKKSMHTIVNERFNKKGWGYYSSQEGYKRGLFFSPNGIVEVYASGGKENYISLSFVHNQKLYEKSFRGAKSITDRSLSIYAGKFVRSIINGNSQTS